MDEYGLLPVYRFRLLNTSKKVIPASLIYLGNFKDAARPNREFVPFGEINIRAIFWKNFDRTFETEAIAMYFGHNRREYSIYHKS